MNQHTYMYAKVKDDPGRVASPKFEGYPPTVLARTDALRITERFTRVDRDQINYEALIEDRKVFTKPWTVRTTLILHADPYREFLKHRSLLIRTPLQ